MARTKASIGQKSKFGIKGSGSTYAYVAEVTAITPPGMTRDAIDATHLESDDEYKEFIAGLKEAGEAQITINYEPKVSDDLVTAFNEGVGDFRILFPSGTVALDFFGIVTAFEFGELTSDKMSATFTVKASGKATLSTVSAGA